MFRSFSLHKSWLIYLLLVCFVCQICNLFLYGNLSAPTNNVIKLLDVKTTATNICISDDQYQWTKVYCLTATKNQNGVDCIPEYRCKKKISYREWNVCVDHLILDNCLVYSIGVDRDWNFDAMMGQLGCEVHSFDPTITLPTNLAPNVTFHKIGISGANNTVGVAKNFSHSLYGEIEGEMLTVAQIMNKLGHKNRQITLLKIDCEGCE
eukprot:522653_1